MDYVIGVDFGTLSCRAVLLDGAGNTCASAQMDYAHGIVEGADGSLQQVPADYLACLRHTVTQVAAGRETEIRALGLDFTACTVLAVDEALSPLENARLWKSHSAREQAQRVQTLCRELGMDLTNVGGTISPENLLPKLLELKERRPEVYNKCAHFLEAGDWLVWLLTGNRVRSACMAGFKGLWDGQWPRKVLEGLELDAALLSGAVLPAGSFAGRLNAFGAELLGLSAQTAVAVSFIDAHAALPAAGLSRAGEMMLILGTSGCQILLSDKEAAVPGVFGRVRDGVLPGLYAYECGQAALGDMFAWFVKTCVPPAYHRQAEGDIFGYLEKLAADITDNSVWALDWWNGSRSPYANAALTGSLFGLTLQTRPEHIYRALLEAAAFGTRQIFEMLESRGVEIRRVCAGGGIAKKNGLYMQILADVLGREIWVTDSEPASAVGAAILAAWAGSLYDSPQAAIAAMAKAPKRVYRPEPGVDYEARYARYVQTADAFAQK